jgi:hypothetical protein
MSKKKSLGSSPIGYSALGAERSSFHFIPKTRISQNKENEPALAVKEDEGQIRNTSRTGSSMSEEMETPEKKITSYYLEVELIHRLKIMADEKGQYYSSLVNEAIEYWVELHGY